MSFSTQIHSYLTWVFFFLLLFFFFSFTLSDPRISEAGLYCGTSKSLSGTKFIPTFVAEMESLSQLVTSHHWGTHLVNSTPPIYGLAQCHQDLSHTDCLLCFAASRTKLPRCLPAVSARIYFDGCFLRYDNYSFYTESISPHGDTVNCSSESGTIVGNDVKLDEFHEIVRQVTDNLTKRAVSNGGFGVWEVKRGELSVYGLAQCWKSVGSDGCRACLEKASNGVRKCVPKRDGRGLNIGCYLRYSTQKFYNDGEDNKSEAGLFHTGATIAIVLTVAAFLMVSLFAAYAGYVRLQKMKAGRKNCSLVSISFNKCDLNFKYETLEKATEYFDPSRKLGQGGAGSVYKGTLSDGKVVAVKRLIFNSRQWVDEFFNEVNLISGIHHKNLVKLLGCSIEGPESLLVYEYVLNKSLDEFIFDKNKVPILNWKQRFHIIVGIAEGLAYLHGGSQIRIIHRDIKCSNVLLDENLNPKVADFGLVRCFAADKTHISTGIAGTLGYMAPEYLVRGQLTDKSDVYSYGVLVLEIVCGRRNNVYTEDSGSLLQIVWKLYKSNKLTQCIDPCLTDDIPVKEVSNVLQIALLCAQASVALRPSMDEVVEMLTFKDCEIPIPNQPPFLSASELEPGTSTRSYSINSLVSNAATKMEVSCSSTEMSSTESLEGPSRSGESKRNPTPRPGVVSCDDTDLQ